MTTTANIEFNSGETTTYVFPVIDGDGVAVDVDGWTAVAQIRQAPGAPVIRHEWSAGNSNITVAGTSVTLLSTAADTSSWAWSTGYYQIELTDTADNVYRIAQGKVSVSREVTR